MRFIKDCEKVLGKEVNIIKSPLGSVENAIREAGIIRHTKTGYAPCTVKLKKEVRRKWEQEHADYEANYRAFCY